MSSTIITTRDPVSHRFSSGRTRSRNVVIYKLRIRDHLRDGKRWCGWKKEDNEEEREGGREREISLPGRRRYGIPLDINRASCTKGGPLLSGHFIGAPGTI